jgi:arylsulfatase A-like enzyme
VKLKKRLTDLLVSVWGLVILGVGVVWAERPNILMILVDDLGVGDVACLGAEDMRTPRLDTLFASGRRFDQFYANCTVCSPSRASLLTGRTPDAVGVPGVIRQDEDDSWGYFDPTVRTLADQLGAAGYATALIGKWHLGLEAPNLPNRRGFDYFKGFLGDMMDDYWTHLRGGLNWMRENETVIQPEGHATDLFARWSQEYIEDRAGLENPFFLYLAFNAPHSPIQPPVEWLERVEAREPGLSPERARLVAFIEHLDARIGDVLQTLEQTGLARNTLVVFASDNGGALRYAASNGALRGGKQDHFEGGIRVPMAAVWPGRIPSGSSTANIAQLMDLFPTFCEVAAADSGKAVDGISLLPTLLGEEQVTDDRVLFWVRQEGNMRFGGQTYYAARHKQFKILQNTPWEPYSFFDLAADPMEQSPLPPRGDVYDFLFRQLMEHIRTTTVPAKPGHRIQ